MATSELPSGRVMVNSYSRLADRRISNALDPPTHHRPDNILRAGRVQRQQSRGKT